MQESFILEDLINTLISLEDAGNKVYLNLAQNSDDRASKELFEFLAKQELNHKKIYKEYLTKFNYDFQGEEEYIEYVKRLLKGNIELVSYEEENFEYNKALEIALKLEKDTIAFLEVMKKILGERKEEKIEEIMEEERKHLRLISGLKDRKGD